MESTEAPEVERAPALIPGGMISRVGIGTVAADVSLEDASLHPDEWALAADMPDAKRASFVAGRRALRAALVAAVPQVPHGPLLRTHRGGPLLPHGVMGSISHKRTHAVALAAPAPSHPGIEPTGRPGLRQHVGIDLEERPSAARADRSRALALRILTARERDVIDALTGYAHLDATILRFALKEAVYKAIDPHVQRYVRFTEVEVEVEVDVDTQERIEAGITTGLAHVALLLPERPPLTVHAAWQVEQHWIIATAISETRV